jgi:predicted nucleic acid-binding protein
MIVVSNTSPLNYLVLIGHSDVLPALFHRVVALTAVIAELLHPRAPAAVRTWAGSPPSWLEIIPPAVKDLTLHLGAGESEAIAIASELNADFLLIDERKATVAALRRGLQVVGTLTVLALAAERNLLDLSSAIAALRQTTFREPEDLIAELLARDEQRRSGL